MKQILQTAFSYWEHRSFEDFPTSTTTCSSSPHLPTSFLVVSPQFLNVLPEVFFSLIQSTVTRRARSRPNFSPLVKFIENNSPTLQFQLICFFFSPHENNIEIVRSKFRKMQHIFEVVLVADFTSDSSEQVLHPLLEPQSPLNQEEFINNNHQSSSTISVTLSPLLQQPLPPFVHLLLSRPELRRLTTCFGGYSLDCPNAMFALVLHHPSPRLRRQVLHDYIGNGYYRALIGSGRPVLSPFWDVDERRVDLLLERIEVMFRDEVVDDESAHEMITAFCQVYDEWLRAKTNWDLSRIDFVQNFIISGMFKSNNSNSLVFATQAFREMLLGPDKLWDRDEIFEENFDLTEFVSTWLPRLQEFFARQLPFICTGFSSSSSFSLAQWHRKPFGPKNLSASSSSSLYYAYDTKVFARLLETVSLLVGPLYSEPHLPAYGVGYWYRTVEIEEQVQTFLASCSSFVSRYKTRSPFRSLVRTSDRMARECVGATFKALGGAMIAHTRAKFLRRRESFVSELMANLKASTEFLRRDNNLRRNRQENKKWIESTSFLQGVTVRDLVAMHATIHMRIFQYANPMKVYATATSEEEWRRVVDGANAHTAAPFVDEVIDDELAGYFPPEVTYLRRRRLFCPYLIYSCLTCEDRSLIWEDDDDFNFFRCDPFIKTAGDIEEEKNGVILSDGDGDQNEPSSQLRSLFQYSGKITFSEEHRNRGFTVDDWFFQYFTVQSTWLPDRFDASTPTDLTNLSSFLTTLLTEAIDFVVVLENKELFMEEGQSLNTSLFFYCDPSHNQTVEQEQVLIKLVKEAAVNESKMYFEAFFVDNNNNNNNSNNNNIKVTFWSELLHFLYRGFEESNTKFFYRSPSEFTSLQDGILHWQFVIISVSIYRLHQIYHQHNTNPDQGKRTTSSSSFFNIVEYMAYRIACSQKHVMEMYCSFRPGVPYEIGDFSVEWVSRMNQLQVLDFVKLLVEAWECVPRWKFSKTSDDHPAIASFLISICEIEEINRNLLVETANDEFNWILGTRMLALKTFMCKLNSTLLSTSGNRRRQRGEDEEDS